MVKKISPYDLHYNTFDLIENQWMLITAGNKQGLNMMTANWGGFGFLWDKPVITCYIRPQRYTRQFIDRNEYLSLSFFESNYREVLKFCGEKSGLYCDKIAFSGLTPVYDMLAPYYKEAKLVIICRKMYCQQMDSSNFIDKSIDKQNYSDGDYHFMYICEIVDSFIQSNDGLDR